METSLIPPGDRETVQVGVVMAGRGCWVVSIDCTARRDRTVLKSPFACSRPKDPCRKGPAVRRDMQLSLDAASPFVCWHGVKRTATESVLV